MKVASVGAGFRQLLSDYQRRARTRGHVWELTEPEFRALVESDCFFCGRHRPHLRHGTYRYTGVDRFDNDKGYTRDNSVPCCGRCNFMKAGVHGDEFLLDVGRIATNRMAA